MSDPNKLRHIFGNPSHNLGPIVQHFGSEGAAFRAIEDEVNRAYQDGRLVTDAYGLYQQVFDIGGYSVSVKGRIINGQVHIGTAWGPPETNTNFIGRFQPPKYAAPKYARSSWQNTAQDLPIRRLDVEDRNA